MKGLLTDNTLASDSPMADRVLGDFSIFVRLSSDVDGSAGGDWVPRRHSHEYVVGGIPITLRCRVFVDVETRRGARRFLRREGSIFAFFIIYNYCAVCVGNKEEGSGGGYPANCGTGRI